MTKHEIQLYKIVLETYEIAAVCGV